VISVGLQCKGERVVPPLPLDIDELMLRITTAIETTGRSMLERVGDKLDCK
jgi:hypothetical protein